MRSLASLLIFSAIALAVERWVPRAPLPAYTLAAFAAFVALQRFSKSKMTWLVSLGPLTFNFFAVMDDAYGPMLSGGVEVTTLADLSASLRRKPVQIRDYVVEYTGPSLSEHYVTRTRRDASKTGPTFNDVYRSSHTLSFDARPLRPRGAEDTEYPTAWLVCTLGQKSCSAYFEEFDGGGYLLGQSRGRNERDWLSSYVEGSVDPGDFHLIEPRANIKDYDAGVRRNWYVVLFALATGTFVADFKTRRGVKGRGSA